MMKRFYILFLLVVFLVPSVIVFIDNKLSYLGLYSMILGIGTVIVVPAFSGMRQGLWIVDMETSKNLFKDFLLNSVEKHLILFGASLFCGSILSLLILIMTKQ